MSGLTVTSTRDFRYQTRCAMKKTVQQKKDREVRFHIRNEIRDEISQEVTEELNTIKNSYRRSSRTQRNIRM